MDSAQRGSRTPTRSGCLSKPDRHLLMICLCENDARKRSSLRVQDEWVTSRSFVQTQRNARGVYDL
jgi:hypothetical protein